MTAPNNLKTDDDSFEVLDAYLNGLHGGLSLSREDVLRQRPELAAAIECLEALDQFAAQAADLQARDPANAPTLELSAESVPTQAAMALPRELGDYELVREIGRGGMGAVYQARQKSLRRMVALKIIHGYALASPDQLRRFAAEAQAAASLRHANIVRVLDSGQIEGIPYLAMDYIEGESLAQRLARGPLDRESAVRLLCAVARAVDYLHHQGIIHRDLKPSNILLDGEGQPIVTDFGLAKLLSDDAHLTQTGMAAGTPSYMAPEQAAGQSSRVTPACDIYSLGAVFYELLTGRPPFQAETAIDVLIQVLEREPPAPRQLDRSIPRTLSQICLKCLEKDPANRYPSAGALAADLERYLKGEPVEVSAGNFWTRVGRWARREPALALRLALLPPLYGIEQLNYFLRRWDAQFHYPVMTVLTVWIALSFAFQRLMRRDRWHVVTPAIWALVDTAALLSLLLLGDGLASPLMIGYPLLIVGAGLWFRVRLVSLVTALSVACYAVLLFDYHAWRHDILKGYAVLDANDPIAYTMALIAMGAAVAYQVQRVRALSRFYERQK